MSATGARASASSAAPPSRVLIDFEGIPLPVVDASAPVPDGYKGLNWSNVEALNAFLAAGEGYFNVLNSGSQVGFDPLGLGGSFSASGWDFDLRSGFFAAAQQEDLTVTIEGYDDGVRVATKTLVLDPVKTFVTFGATFSSIDEVRFDGHDGPSGTEQGTQVALEDLRLAFVPQRITGTQGNDTLIGTGGADIINALGGRDRVSGNGFNDFIDGGTGNDTLRGGLGDDTIRGGTGNDVIDGGGEASFLGIDTADYGDAPAGVVVDLGAGTATGGAGGDRLAGIEALRGSAFNDRLVGSAADNTILGLQGNDTVQGGAGHDRLDGSRGNDTVEGGAGNDTLLGGRGNDRLDGGNGLDTADYSGTRLGVTVWLATGTATGELGTDTLVNIETVLGGSSDDALTGNSAANLLVGGAGDDMLDGGRDNDTLQGGDGNDTLIGARNDDQLEGGAGKDWLRGDTGNDTLLGGNNNDRLAGGAGDDLLVGGDGADELRGEAGSDTLHGGAAGDRLYGGSGVDELVGGEGADRFIFTAVGESGTTAATRDSIVDFEVGLDRIHLSKIDADQTDGGNQAFSFIGTGAFTAAGQVRFVQDAAGNRTLVEGNVDGDLAPDFQIDLIGLHSLAAGDFVL